MMPFFKLEGPPAMRDRSIAAAPLILLSIGLFLGSLNPVFAQRAEDLEALRQADPDIEFYFDYFAIMRSVIEGATALRSGCTTAEPGRWPKEGMEWSASSIGSLDSAIAICEASFKKLHRRIARRVPSQTDALDRVVEAIAKDVADNLGHFVPHVIITHRGLAFACASAISAAEECSRLAEAD